MKLYLTFCMFPNLLPLRVPARWVEAIMERGSTRGQAAPDNADLRPCQCRLGANPHLCRVVPGLCRLCAGLFMRKLLIINNVPVCRVKRGVRGAGAALPEDTEERLPALVRWMRWSRLLRPKAGLRPCHQYW